MHHLLGGEKINSIFWNLFPANCTYRWKAFDRHNPQIMKTLQICIPTGVFFVFALLIYAPNAKPSIEYQYEHCLEKLMKNYELDSEQAALDKFQELTAAKTKISQADRILGQINRVGEGPIARSQKESSGTKRAFARQLQVEATQLLQQLEGELIADNAKP